MFPYLVDVGMDHLRTEGTEIREFSAVSQRGVRHSLLGKEKSWTTR